MPASVNITIGSVEIDEIIFSYTATLPKNTSDQETPTGPGLIQYQFKEGEAYTANKSTEPTSLKSSSSTSSSCVYKRYGTGTTTDTLTVSITYQQRESYHSSYIDDGPYGPYPYRVRNIWALDLNDAQIQASSLNYTDENGTKYYFSINGYTGQTQESGGVVFQEFSVQYYYSLQKPVYAWGNWEDVSNPLTASKSFYPHPAKFTFINCVQGGRWLVEEGINKTLITNITDFQGQAQQRKNWKHQLEEGFSVYKACPSFFDDNVITRNQMNEVYKYVMEITTDKYPATEKYIDEEGQEKERPLYHKISAVMFNDLADRINEKTS